MTYKLHIQVLDHGHVDLVDYCANDLDVINAARVSFNKHSPAFVDGDEKLISFLMKNKHGTPFEHSFFRFRIKAPIFVFREWHRHRIGHSYNEMSARYTELPEEFYIPSIVLEQKGKPGNYVYDDINTPEKKLFQNALEKHCMESFIQYRYAMSIGVSKQQARLFLTVGTYSEMYWSCNARSLMAFLELRNHEKAQYEIQEFAKAAETIFRLIMPITAQYFVENGHIAP